MPWFLVVTVLVLVYFAYWLIVYCVSSGWCVFLLYNPYLYLASIGIIPVILCLVRYSVGSYSLLVVMCSVIGSGCPE